VDIERLDKLMNTIGELVLTKAAVGRISKELRNFRATVPFLLTFRGSRSLWIRNSLLYRMRLLR